MTIKAPESVNLTDAARAFLTIVDDPNLGSSHRLAASMVWVNLTGLADRDALEFARGIVAGTYTPYSVRYFLPPL